VRRSYYRDVTVWLLTGAVSTRFSDKFNRHRLSKYEGLMTSFLKAAVCYFCHMRKPPRKAFLLLPSRAPEGSLFNFLLFPPPSIT